MAHVLLIFAAISTVVADLGITVAFRNMGKVEGQLSWVSGDTKLDVGKIQPGKDVSQDTYGGHSFEFAVTGFPTKRVLVRSDGVVLLEPKDGEITVSGAALAHTERKVVYEGEKWDAIVGDVHKRCEDIWGEFPQDRAHYCNSQFDMRTFTTAKFDHSDEQMGRMMKNKQASRIRDTARQPSNLYNFTKTGFQVTNISQDIYDELSSFHKRTRVTSSRPESMPFDDPNLSGRDAETWVSHLPRDMKDRMFKHVRKMVSEWTGVPEEDLLETALYGIRMYHKGSVLYSHCDRRDTHVLSAILEVGRSDATDTAPWPLTIMDHAGEENVVPDRPGQLILYESATCAHGRVDPFPGREMANTFVHFRPKGWPEKYIVQTSDKSEL